MKIGLVIQPTELRPTPTKAFLQTRSGNRLDLYTVVGTLDEEVRFNFVCGATHLEEELCKCVNEVLKGKPNPTAGLEEDLRVSPIRLAELRKMEYGMYLRTPEWGRTRQQALERACFRCQVCSGSARLEVHHRTYENLGNEMPGDLTTLCKECHEVFHENGRLVRP